MRGGLKRFNVPARAIAIASAVLTLSAGLACGRASETPGEGAMTGGGHGPLTITFRSQPDPPATGENRFEVTVQQPNGEPVRDADVSVGFYMPAMPDMKMPEMRNEVKLAPAGDGKYSGTGQVTMAGTWEVTVTARRNGQEIGSRKLTVVAK
jgi:hypothetical protein